MLPRRASRASLPLATRLSPALSCGCPAQFFTWCPRHSSCSKSWPRKVSLPLSEVGRNLFRRIRMMQQESVMAQSTTSLTNRPAWRALQAHYNQSHTRHLRAMFAEDPKRGERLVVEAAGLYFDYSKHRVTDETLRLLLALADEVGLHGRIDAMFRGDKINVTEKRAVLHIA